MQANEEQILQPIPRQACVRQLLENGLSLRDILIQEGRLHASLFAQLAQDGRERVDHVVFDVELRRADLAGRLRASLKTSPP